MYKLWLCCSCGHVNLQFSEAGEIPTQSDRCRDTLFLSTVPGTTVHSTEVSSRTTQDSKPGSDSNILPSDSNILPSLTSQPQNCVENFFKNYPLAPCSSPFSVPITQRKHSRKSKGPGIPPPQHGACSGFTWNKPIKSPSGLAPSLGDAFPLPIFLIVASSSLTPLVPTQTPSTSPPQAWVFTLLIPGIWSSSAHVLQNFVQHHRLHGVSFNC